MHLAVIYIYNYECQTYYYIILPFYRLEEAVTEGRDESSNKRTGYTALDLFRYSKIRRRTILLLYIW